MRSPRHLPATPRRVAGMEFEEFVRVVAEAVHRRAFTATLRREHLAQEQRSLRVWQETVRTRTRVINLEAALARRPEIRRLIRSLPADLKRISVATVPFPEPLWSRGGGRGGGGKEEGVDALLRTPTGAGTESRLGKALAYLARHPRATAEWVAQRYRVSAIVLRRSPRYREILMARGPRDARLTRWYESGRSGKVARALDLLGNGAWPSIRQLARAVGIAADNLQKSRRFRAAWEERQRQGTGDRGQDCGEEVGVSKGSGCGGGAAPLGRELYRTPLWRGLSDFVRFERARGYCENCGVSHGQIAPDWRSVIFLYCAHVNGNRSDLRLKNLRALCARCHFLLDHPRRACARGKGRRVCVAGGGAPCWGD